MYPGHALELSLRFSRPSPGWAAFNLGMTLYFGDALGGGIERIRAGGATAAKSADQLIGQAGVAELQDGPGGEQPDGSAAGELQQIAGKGARGQQAHHGEQHAEGGDGRREGFGHLGVFQST